MSRKDSKGKVLNKGESQRNDGRYVYRWKDYTGKQKQIYAKTLNELRQLEKDIIYQTSVGLSLDLNNTLNSIIEKWLKVKQDITLSSKRLYELNYSSVIKHSKVGQMKVSQIKKSDILYFLKILSEEKNFKGSTINTIFTVVNQSLQLAYEDGLIIRNPCWGIKISDKSSKSNKIALTDEQEKELLYRIENSPKSKRIYPLVSILLNTGLRISEAVALTWDDVDIENGLFKVNKQLISLQKDDDNKKRKLTITQPKTNSGIRTIYMTDCVKNLFIRQKEISSKTNSTIKIDNHSDFVFTTNRGTNLSVRSLEYSLKYLSELNEGRDVILPHITPHILRHTACTKMINSGMNIKAVQTLMGHSNVDITLQIYTHINENQLRDEIKKLNMQTDTN